MKIIKELFTKYSDWLLVLSIGFIAVASLLSSGLPPTHDGEYHVLRFQQFYKVLSEGSLYPRWAPDFNNGFGIPLFNYVYPLPNYIASALHILGFSFIDSFKLNMILASLTGSFFFYLWTKSYWGKAGGLVSSVFYTFSPYHLVDIYVRGSVGEVWALGVFPILLWSYLNFHKKNSYIFFIISCLSLSLVILSHNILALLFFGFFIFYALFLILNSDNIKSGIIWLIVIIFTGFGISSPFWLPAILETNLVRGLQIFDPTKNFPEIYQLTIPSWGYGLSPSDLANPMSVQIGVANILSFILSLALIFFYKNKKTLLFFISSFIVVFFFMTSFSEPLWRQLPLLSYFQFPWRLLSLEILIASLLAGALPKAIGNKKFKVFITITIVTFAVATSLSYARGATYYQRNDDHYLTRSNFTDGTNSPGNVFNTRWLSEIPKKSNSKFEFIQGKGDLKVLDLRSVDYKLVINAEENSKLLVNTAFFPGWIYKMDGRKINVQNFRGKILIEVPKGSHFVEIKLTNTLIQNLSYLYLCISVVLLVFIRKRIGIIK
ncbi:MAG: 6-pyruvoyl-tetrahydropterin synthase-related protein [Patescibacteria group bacterium]